ncbi:MAG: hypothetical protein COU29_02380 [Candidatus Magasanikbacteria bacterium CG10_big_fil_rev_8_21_14_0_10_36_32]|uniref:Dinitrogenase iron-molybdenum cofactor biosynthesis domain-containing protein n=1 Tax=Candidatus Magasanikbacteria bacterium CG10_big_fil_rev_8_21_14_0_10_36_32 TaxID=1974646 RepID=A0A2M6W734_9BACT|nr:MAG: hypothetical protein COU29_02380 [Candidatus Magasanikbacteria bacterium CG10_big_fil_rev_8_21_14_0_10_36_32]
MKIAISSTGKNIDSNISDIFGRCPYFIIVEIKNGKTGKVEVIKNNNADHVSGAGIFVAQLLAEKNVNAVITGNVGPRAVDILKQFNIDVYNEKGVVKSILQEFINKKFKQ